MYPVLFQIGPLSISSYGFCLSAGILLGWYYFRLQFKDTPYHEPLTAMVCYSVFGGLVISRLNYMTQNWREIESFRDFTGMLFTPGGLTAYGGILGGLGTAFVYSRSQKLPVWRIMDVGGPTVCIGGFFARLGCQLAGDGDYGVPTTLPWATSYPDGLIPTTARVHPAPVYEMLMYAAMFFLLSHIVKKQNLRDGLPFAIFLVLCGVERFSVEIVRRNPRIIGGLSEAQLVSLILIALGVGLAIARRNPENKKGGMISPARIK